MTENETKSKKKKNGMKFEKVLVTWAVGFILVILMTIITGENSALTLLLMVVAFISARFQEYVERRERKKYDTGTLALRETEP